MSEVRRLRQTQVAVLFGLFAVLAILGCEDPSNVGLGLIGESGGDPVRVVLPGIDSPEGLFPPVTSNEGTSYAVGASQIMTGSVADPLFGTVSATAYIDVALISSQTSDYRSGSITSVDLVLEPDYVYGDTTASTELVISEMGFNWPSDGLKADTTLTGGTEIARVDYVYSDTLLVVSLPSEWYSARSSILLGTDVADTFHGFEISTTVPAAVVGFSASSGILRITTTSGTAELVVSEIFTHVERLDDANIPAGRLALQDGIGSVASFEFDFDADSLRGAAVSRAVVEFSIDRESMDAVPEHFVRPEPAQYDFLGVRDDGTTRTLRSALASEDAIRFVSTTATPGEFTIVRTAQRASTGAVEFPRFRVVITETQAAINPILIYGPDAETGRPQAILTVAPSAF